MSMPGSNGVGCATSLTSAARLAAATAACHIPALDCPADKDPARRPATHPHGGADRFGPPRPGTTDCNHPPVVGGGAAATGARPAVLPDPALAALAGMLGSATPPPRGESVLQQLTNSLSNLLASISSRLGALATDRSDPGATAPLPLPAEPTAELPLTDPSLLLRQPPPPPIGPILSLDPATGMIIDPLDSNGDGHHHGGGEGGQGALVEDPQVGLPSSWVPVPSGVLARVRRRLGSIADRLDALLDEVGMTRLQLLLLTLLGPAAVAFAIDVVAQLLAER
ncbi:MAG: hypothetical protein JWL76_187 [Thermoleophilia bacterium]|nr:hypothetical protein [Thermoleophilia bacterium]